MGKSAINKRLAKVEAELKKDKPEVKTIDVLLSPLTVSGTQLIWASGIDNGTDKVNYDLTDGFIQGLLNTGGNIEGNYCKLTSMDLRIQLQNVANATGTTQPSRAVRKVRLIIFRLPNASVITPAIVQTEILEYGAPGVYGQLCNVSPLKRNSTINGGYDIMLDKTIMLNDQTLNPNKSTKYIHYKKTWKKGLQLRFSGSGAGLNLEQNRIYLFAMDSDNRMGQPGVHISFINRIRYSDE